MRELLNLDLGRRRARVAYTTRAQGDLGPSAVAPGTLATRRRAVVDHPWCATRQVHGDRVVRAPVAAAPGERVAGDAVVTDDCDTVLAVHSGDCVTVGFVHGDGVVGVAHGGWKGLEAGVLESTVRAIRQAAGPTTHGRTAGAGGIRAVVGPHIRARRYEFGAADLDRLAARFGDRIVARTACDRPALDLTALVAGELDRLEVEVLAWAPECTADNADLFWSHRARGESGRIALVAWMEAV